MKAILTLVVLSLAQIHFCLAQGLNLPPQKQAVVVPTVPKDRLVTAAHYLQVAEIYAKTGAKPNIEENRTVLSRLEEKELRAEILRMLPVFQTSTVVKSRRPEVAALYVGAIKKLTVNQDADHAGIVKWIESNPDKFAPTIRKFGQMGTDALK